MVKKLILISCLFSLSLYAAKNDNTIYETDCVKCHNRIPVTIDKYFYRYLLKYSSEKDVKKAMFEFLKEPTKENSIMSESFITRFGVKKKTKLSDKNLKEAIDSYWEEYKVFGKLQ